MTDLMQRLYEKAGGKIYRNTTTCDGANWAGADTIATAPASGTLWITNIYVNQTAANVKTNIGISAEGDEFADITSTTVLTGTINIDMSDCPMTLTDGTTLKAANESATTTYITVRGYYT